MTSIYCPATFRPDDLPGDEQQFADGIGYFMHAVMLRRIHDSRYRKGYRRGFVALKSDFMRRILGRHNWTPVRRLAIAHRFIECDERFLAGSHAKGYRILPPHVSVPWPRHDVDDRNMAVRLTRWRNDRRRAIWEAIHAGKASIAPDVCDFLFEHLQRVELRDDAPLDQFAPEVAIAADLIRHGEWFFVPDKYGRLHTNLTNLKRELRPFLKVDGAVLGNLDIANSQPLFAGILTKRRKEEKGEGEEKGRREPSQGLYVGQSDIDGVAIQDDNDKYLNLCENGSLYRFVHEHLPDGRDFAQTKKRVLTTLFDRDNRRNAVYRVLDEHFPVLMDFIRREKRGDHHRFAHLAQRTESDFMFGQVVPRLMREQPDMFVGTIHDSVLTPASEAEYVHGAMMTEFGRLGVTPTVRGLNDGE
jgi:hypothetical protein